MILTLKWGQYSMEAKVLNIKESNYKHLGYKNKGVNAQIYCGKYLNKEITIKCIKIRSEKTRNLAIREWFIARIASANEIGPKIESYFGFDLLMFE